MLFVAFTFGAALEYAEDQSFIETPALGWSGLVRAAALPTGLLLIALAGVVQILHYRMRDVLAAGAVLAAGGRLLWVGGPALKGMGNWNLVVFFIGLLGLGSMAGCRSRSASRWRRWPTC